MTFLHRLDPKQPSALRAVHESLTEKRHDVVVYFFVEGSAAVINWSTEAVGLSRRRAEYSLQNLPCRPMHIEVMVEREHPGG